MQDADAVVESFDEAERHFVVDVAIADDSVPVSFDHAGECLVGFQPLPAERTLPSFVKSFGIDGGVVAPELSELFFEQVGFIESSVGLEEQFQGRTSIAIEVLFVRQQSIFLTFNITSGIALEAFVLALADLVEGVVEVSDDVEFIVDDFGPGDVLSGRIAKCLPHVHDDESHVVPDSEG